MNALLRPVVAVRLGALLGFLAVSLGAFGAHGLKERLTQTPRGLEYWDTATHYALAHAVALIALGALAERAARPVAAGRAALAWFAGVTVFSGTLMAMALGAPKVLGAITPLGGLALLAGWALAGLSTLPPRRG